MTKFLVTLVAVVSLFTMMSSDVEARRMGGGKSFGKQSSNVTQKQAPAQPGASNPAQAAKPTTAPTPAASPWKGMLGGALLGLGLGALLSSLGIGAGLANFISILLMVGLGIAAVSLLMRLFGKKNARPVTPSMANAYAGMDNAVSTPEIGSGISAETNASRFGGTSLPTTDEHTSRATWNIPAGFDVLQFERTAQTYFIRLQAAWDKADINDLREFTTPEMFAEIKLQIQERGAAPSVTDIMMVNAKLMGIETLDSSYLASVRFVGTLKEEVDGPTTSFDEVWNLTKPISAQGGWMLAGIQQMDEIA